MYCTSCGQPRPDDAATCPSCSRRVQRFPPPPDIPNYLVQSILVTLCCCVPLGVVAVIYSAQVNGKVASGDIAGALAASKNAKVWAWIAFAAGALVAIVYFVMGVVGGIKS
jgi:hypothetical protein